MGKLMRKMRCYSDVGMRAFWAFPFPKPGWRGHPLLILPERFECKIKVKKKYCKKNRVRSILLTVGSKNIVISQNRSNWKVFFVIGVRVTGEGFGSGVAHITVTTPSKRSPPPAVSRILQLWPSPTHNCKIANRFVRMSFSCKFNPMSPVMSDTGPVRLQNSWVFSSKWI